MKKFYLYFAALSMLAFQACNDYEPVAGIPPTVQFSSTSVSGDESTPEPIVVEVQLLAPQQSSPITVDYDMELTNLVEGEDFEFIGGSDLVIPANSSTGTLTIQPIDNEDISTSPQTIKLTLISASGNVSVGSETAPQRSVTISINEDDFFCPRNDLAKVVTTETDLGYSSSAVSIELALVPGDCYDFIVVGGGGSIFGTENIQFGPISLVEDAPESSTGTIADGSVTFQPAGGGDDYTNSAGDVYNMTISNGVYDLETRTFQFDYVLYAGSSPLFPGTLIYD